MFCRYLDLTLRTLWLTLDIGLRAAWTVKVTCKVCSSISYSVVHQNWRKIEWAVFFRHFLSCNNMRETFSKLKHINYVFLCLTANKSADVESPGTYNPATLAKQYKTLQQGYSNINLKWPQRFISMTQRSSVLHSLTSVSAPSVSQPGNIISKKRIINNL